MSNEIIKQAGKLFLITLGLWLLFTLVFFGTLYLLNSNKQPQKPLTIVSCNCTQPQLNNEIKSEPFGHGTDRDLQIIPENHFMNNSSNWTSN